MLTGKRKLYRKVTTKEGSRLICLTSAWVPAGDMRKWSSHHIREYQQKVRKEKTSLQAQQLIEKGRLRRKERVESPATKESEDRHSHPHR